MLSPDDRALLVDLLSPPEDGFRLVHAVATTFTLQLSALLPIPLALAGMDLSAGADPLGVWQAIRRFSDRIDVFCQAGHASAPTTRNDLVAFLEPIVHQVGNPAGRLFHPKIWLLRFAAPDGEESVRLVCGSRNLTHDRAWDAAVCLEGRRRGRPAARNRPLVDFVLSLAGRTTTPLAPARRAALAETAEAVRYIDWEPPDGVSADTDWLAFHVLGGRRRSVDLDGARRLIISPFLNAEGFEKVWPQGKGSCTIVSRAEELDSLPEDRRGWINDRNCALRVFHDAAAIPELDSDDAGLRWSLSGLHAKVYVIERDHTARVLIGSANATGAAWSGNDEILVEIRGRRAVLGIAATLNEDSNKGLGSVLVAHTFGVARGLDPSDELRRELERALRHLAAYAFTATVITEEVATHLRLSTVEDITPISTTAGEARLTVEPITTAGQHHQPPSGAPLGHTWQLNAVEDITPFVVLRLAAGSGAAAVEVSAVAIATLVDDPSDRLDRLIARHIGSPAAFVRFLMLLLQLAGDDNSLEGFALLAGGGGPWRLSGDEEGSGLLEAMAVALATAPAVIDDVERFVSRLTTTEAGRSLLPDGWEPFWAQVCGARKLQRAHR